jgi:hypothetical protein
VRGVTSEVIQARPFEAIQSPELKKSVNELFSLQAAD